MFIRMVAQQIFFKSVTQQVALNRRNLSVCHYIHKIIQINKLIIRQCRDQIILYAISVRTGTLLLLDHPNLLQILEIGTNGFFIGKGKIRRHSTAANIQQLHSSQGLFIHSPQKQ
ncbi:hypothetical protein D3C76_1273800 [compost metagenome]